MKWKPVKCIDCGFLGIMRSGHSELERLNRLGRDLLKQGQMSARTEEYDLRCLKAFNVDLSTPGVKLVSDRDLFEEAPCDGFEQFKPGLTPQEHLDWHRFQTMRRWQIAIFVVAILSIGIAICQAIH